jgi:putative redox protein
MSDIMYSKAKLVENFNIIVDDGRDHGVCLDLPPDLGTNLGPTALELCVMSLSGCITTIFALTAKKMRISISNLEVQVEATKSKVTGTISEVCCKTKVKADASEDRIQRILKLTVKNCPVGKLFEKAGITIKSNLSLIE